MSVVWSKIDRRLSIIQAISYFSFATGLWVFCFLVIMCFMMVTCDKVWHELTFWPVMVWWNQIVSFFYCTFIPLLACKLSPNFCFLFISCIIFQFHFSAPHRYVYWLFWFDSNTVLQLYFRQSFTAKQLQGVPIKMVYKETKLHRNNNHN